MHPGALVVGRMKYVSAVLARRNGHERRGSQKQAIALNQFCWLSQKEIKLFKIVQNENQSKPVL